MVVVPNIIESSCRDTYLFEQLNRHFDDGAAAKEPTELFTKNIGLC